MRCYDYPGNPTAQSVSSRRLVSITCLHATDHQSAKLAGNPQDVNDGPEGYGAASAQSAAGGMVWGRTLVITSGSRRRDDWADPRSLVGPHRRGTGCIGSGPTVERRAGIRGFMRSVSWLSALQFSAASGGERPNGAGRLRARRAASCSSVRAR